MFDENNIQEEQNNENNGEEGTSQQNINDSNPNEEKFIYDESVEHNLLNQKNENPDMEKEIINPPVKQEKKIQSKRIVKENQVHVPVKQVKKKVKAHEDILGEKEKKEKNYNDDITTEELFKKAIVKNANKGFPSSELDNDGNTLSTKVTEVLYDRLVGENIHKSKHLDIYSKIRDEEIRQGRNATRTKGDAQKINNMIVRQEDYEKLKSDKMKGRQREIKNKINEECAFIPNGKKNVSSRNPDEFYNDQKKFIKKKEEIINKMNQKKLETENKNSNVALISKNSEKMANSKNPNESIADFCKRLAEEKLKNKKEVLEAVNKEEKKLTKKELKDLTDKLHKEGETFKNNRIKMEQDQLDKIKKLENNTFVLEKSKKVLFDKFISNYENALLDLFNKKGNFQINYDEYKNVLTNIGFLRTTSSIIENLVKESFNNYLKPNEEKIDTYSFLVFGLAALGIYKGKDEKIEEHSSKVTIEKQEEEKSEENNNQDKEKEKPVMSSSNIASSLNTLKKNQNQNKTSSELIKSFLPDIDLEKYGFSGKECKIIKNKFFPFVSGISELWAKDLYKKKQERLDKLEEINKKTNLEDTKKLKKDEEILNSFRKKVLSKELFQENNDTSEKDNVTTKSYKVEDMYEILQKKKKRELDNLKAKQEEDILQECTFQPNSKTKPVNKKEVAKNIEKLYLEGKESYLKKKQQEEKNLDLNKDNEKNCTFKPAIKDYKGNYFENNPLKEDKLFNSEIRKMEKLREEKGYTNKQIKKQMAFEIEPKSNKEEIYKRVIPNRGEKIVGNVEKEFDGYSNFDDQGNQNILKIEVKLEGNKTDLIIIYPQDDFVKAVDDFCSKHELTEEKRTRLIRVIKDKMRQNEN